MFADAAAQCGTGLWAPPQLAIAVGDASPDPGAVGVLCWSTSVSQLLRWNGFSWGAASAGGFGTAVLDFGSTPGSSVATVDVTGQTGFLSTSHAEVWMQGDTTATHNATEHLIVPLVLKCGNASAGSFTIYGSTTELRLDGTFVVHWTWSN